MIETLRDLATTADLAPRRRLRYAWRPGTVHPFASLWITVMRFALLNRPRFACLVEDLGGPAAAKGARWIPLASREGWPRHGFIDLQFFVRELDEPLQSLRWSSVADFPIGMQALFSPNLSVCPTCMSQAFHSMLFSISDLQRCPVHGDELLRQCPSCDGKLSSRMRSGTGLLPVCRCAHAWISEAQARCPPADPRRDAILGDIVLWIEDSARRFWSYLPGNLDGGSQPETVGRHAQHWSQEMGWACPPWLVSPPVTPDRGGGVVRCLEGSGLRFLGLDRLQHCGLVSHGGHARPAGQEVLSALAVYKSMRRYVIRHLLSGKTHLLIWMGRNHSVEELRRQLGGSARARAAWALLRWMQSSPWGRTFVRDWYCQAVGYERAPGGPGDPTCHWTLQPPPRVIVGHGNEAQMWIGNWLNASTLLDLWPPHQDLSVLMAEGALGYQDPTRQRRRPLSWWAWLATDGKLNLGVYRRKPGWIASPRTSKAERRAEHDRRHTAQQGRLAELVSQPAMSRDADGQWHHEGRRDLAAGAVLKRVRLLADPGTHWHVAVAAEAGADGRVDWILRCLELPVRVMAPTVKSGIAKLKLDVPAYVRFICTPAGTRASSVSLPRNGRERSLAKTRNIL